MKKPRIFVQFCKTYNFEIYSKLDFAFYSNEINQNFLCALPLLSTIWKKKIIKFEIFMRQILVF
jgi:hypothetical protein